MILFGCNKELIKTDDYDFSAPIVEQYIDNKLVGSEFWDKAQDFYSVQINRLNQNNDPIIMNHYFSNESLYVEFGKLNIINLEGQLEFENRVHEYLSLHPSLEQIEDPSNLPADYLEFEQNLKDEIFGKETVKERGTSLIYKECNNNSVAVIPTTLPVMWPGWNNVTSMNFGVYVGAALSIHDRSWYRSRLTTYVWFGGYDCWAGRFYDDRMSSVIQL